MWVRGVLGRPSTSTCAHLCVFVDISWFLSWDLHSKVQHHSMIDDKPSGHGPSITMACHLPLTLKPTDMSPVDRRLNAIGLL